MNDQPDIAFAGLPPSSFPVTLSLHDGDEVLLWQRTMTGPGPLPTPPIAQLLADGRADGAFARIQFATGDRVDEPLCPSRACPHCGAAQDWCDRPGCPGMGGGPGHWTHRTVAESDLCLRSRERWLYS
jgi:hypothetical protein